jgi:hypothetical protein
MSLDHHGRQLEKLAEAQLFLDGKVALAGKHKLKPLLR